MTEGFSYVVTGKFPFPVDMLRRDLSRAASPEDQAKIDMLSAGFLPDDADPQELHAIHLVIPDGVRGRPLTARWESFGWSVPGDLEHAAVKEERSRTAQRAALRRSALAKLTPEEIDALEWYAGRRL
jgi:hypothetical protein